jgi:adenylate kinase family enzyme
MLQNFNTKSRILIVGTSGAGKSTLALQLSRKLGIPDIELDALFWKPNWTQSESEEFRNKIQEAINNKSGFIIHGNYNKVRDLTWGKVDTVIWLDYSRPLILWRVLKRSIFRILRNEALWSNNRESFKKTFFSRDSIILWSWNTYNLRKTQYTQLTQHPEYSNVKIIKFKSPKQTKKFINS